MLKLFSFLSRRKLGPAEAGAFLDALVSADIAPDAADEIVNKVAGADDPKESLRRILLAHAERLAGGAQAAPHDPRLLGDDGARLGDDGPRIPKSALIIGVNGAGKTTTIGKLAAQWGAAGRHVVIGACDTFRAAANEQLDIWAARAGAEAVHGRDPAAVAYQAIANGKSKIEKTSVILDTAGRLHNRDDLMAELARIVRAVKKADQSAPAETWLVLDGTAGQNAIAQIEFFDRAAPLTGLIVTKMDGSSKAGFLISYAARIKSPLPVRYVGYGEGIADLRPFNAEEYVDGIL